ncbi:hypothetical protein PRIPAC_76098 [Pristionchus pacificus]|uniref:Uncharacterized protein n=1 Tax=Pristionchus pacificus TaxID=54126 RepID=A0A2A6C6Z2_PRIPA|nr:hypothetical protein PRIPAC_76098 [Pristionchus pacificus]|eukprot:PDM73876.1 hypothetical protein PRIPAC_41232 [Pristionchus pacificus]
MAPSCTCTPGEGCTECLDKSCLPVPECYIKKRGVPAVSGRATSSPVVVPLHRWKFGKDGAAAVAGMALAWEPDTKKNDKVPNLAKMGVRLRFIATFTAQRQSGLKYSTQLLGASNAQKKCAVNIVRSLNTCTNRPRKAHLITTLCSFLLVLTRRFILHRRILVRR